MSRVVITDEAGTAYHVNSERVVAWWFGGPYSDGQPRWEMKLMLDTRDLHIMFATDAEKESAERALIDAMEARR